MNRFVIGWSLIGLVVGIFAIATWRVRKDLRWKRAWPQITWILAFAGCLFGMGEFWHSNKEVAWLFIIGFVLYMFFVAHLLPILEYVGLRLTEDPSAEEIQCKLKEIQRKR